MKTLLAFLIVLITGNIGYAEDAFDRVATRAQTTEKWKNATTIEARLWAIRSIAEGYGIATNPVSDRYLVTRYGGPIDFVHFLALAAMVCGGKDADEELFKQWKSEGGPEFEAKQTRSYPTEAHPDDLPSNAFGALLGTELRPHNKESSFPVIKTLRAFFDTLSPFPDDLIKKYSHDAVVMGFTGTPTMTERYQRSEWFSAIPLFLVPRLEPTTTPGFRSSRAALQHAGYDVYLIQERPIGIKRINQNAKTEQSGGERR